MHGTQRAIRRKLISLLIMELMIMSPAMAYEPQVPVDPSKVPYDLLIMGDSIWRNDIGGIGSLAGKIHTALGGRATGIVASAEIVGVGPCRIIDTTIAYMNINVVPFQAKVFSFTPGIDQVTGYCGKSKEESVEKYIVDLRKLIAEYKRLQPKGVFVYGLSPRCDECALKYGVCERRDIDVRNLNHAVRQLGPELGFPSIDIHSIGVRYNIPTTDGRHFNDAGALPQSKHLESVLSRYLPYSGTDEAPWVYLTSPDEIVYPVTGKEYTAGVPISLKAVAGGTSTIKKVEFYDDTIKIGEDATEPYEFTVNNPATGQHYFTAALVDRNDVSFPSPVVRAYCAGAPKTATIPLYVHSGPVGNIDAYLPEKIWHEDNDYGYYQPDGWYFAGTGTDGFTGYIGQAQKTIRIGKSPLLYKVRVSDNGPLNLAIHATSGKGFDPGNCSIKVNGSPCKSVADGSTTFKITPTPSRGSPSSIIVNGITPVNGVISWEIIPPANGYIPWISGFRLIKTAIPHDDTVGTYLEFAPGSLSTRDSFGAPSRLRPISPKNAALTYYTIAGRCIAATAIISEERKAARISGLAIGRDSQGQLHTEAILSRTR